MNNKITFLILTSFLFLTLNSFSQEQQSPSSIGEGTMTNLSRSGELDPPANAIYSQQPINTINAFWSDDGTPYQYSAFDDFTGLSSDIEGIVFWGGFYNYSEDCYVSGSSYNFDISFYQDNGGQVGNLVKTFTVTITPTFTNSTINLNGNIVKILRFEVSFPSSVSLQKGWVSVVRKNPYNLSCGFDWINTNIGNKNCLSKDGSSNFHQYNNNLSYCLTGTQSVPVSPWTLVFGIFLIVVFMVVRYRRRIA